MAANVVSYWSYGGAFIPGVLQWPGLRSRVSCSSPRSRMPPRFFSRCRSVCRQRRLCARCWPALVVLFESRLRETADHAHPRRADRRASSASRSPAPSAPASSGPTPAIDRVEFLHSFILIVLPYLGLVLGGKHGEWLEPARLISAVPRRRARSAATRFSTPASSSTAASPTSARPASSTARSSSRSSC